MEAAPLAAYGSIPIDPTSVVVAAVASAVRYMDWQHRKKKKGGKRGATRIRIRREVLQIYDCLGPVYFRRAYRMTYQSFWRLYHKLAPGIEAAREAYYEYEKRGGRAGGNYVDPPIPNGPISGSARLGCALRYFAGGSPYDIMVKFGVCYQDVIASVWIVVQAVNTLTEFHISYPSSFATQERIARAFQNASSVDFDNCAGAIDGILIWMLKPTKEDAERAGVGQKKFFCGRKGKFGLNCQAVSDVSGRILDISITYGGSSSDLLAHEASDLWKQLEDGILRPGLVLYGDNAYLNSCYMVTPYPNVGNNSLEKSKDDFNFFHSQVSVMNCSLFLLLKRKNGSI